MAWARFRRLLLETGDGRRGSLSGDHGGVVAPGGIARGTWPLALTAGFEMASDDVALRSCLSL